MCHSDASRPPSAPTAVPVASSADLVLTAADGNRVLAHEARPTVPSGAGIVVMPDVRGLHEFYKALASRFAEVGVEAVAIDYFGRTAPDDDRSEAFAFMPHVEQTTPEGVAADVQAGVAHVCGNGASTVFTVGFCFGGGYSWRQSADTPGLAGCIGFYGRPASGLEVADRMTAPLLMLVAGADAHIPVEDTRAVADAAPVPTEFVVFEGAPHSFFDRSYDEHVAAADEAWARIRQFVLDHA